MKKRSKILSIITGIAFVCAISLILTNENKGLSFFATEAVTWSHYDYVAPTKSSAGCKEYWVSCGAGHDISFVAPISATIVDKGSPSAALIESMKNDGSGRYIDPITSKLKFAIFADVQLCGKTAIASESSINQGSTANAPLALKNHLQFIKNQNIDVILMNGDITNQANEHYYDYFNSIMEDVYGSDESKYPEFVWNMGNHEWWGGVSESESADCVSMFKQHARIASSNLVHESNVKYGQDSSSTVPSYYKVINGIPFITISGVNSRGEVPNALYNELSSWLTEAKTLSSVINGGPIFVQYHYPLTTSMTHGQGSNSTYCGSVETLLANTPNAIVFTGDTHFPGTNERAINQVNFTTINLGSSSYSRMVQESAVICDGYYNVSGGSGTTKADKLVGNVKFKEAYTPTIQIVDVNTDYSTDIQRYFSQDDGSGVKVGKEWNIVATTSKTQFKYTNARFQNVNSAQALYGKNGLSWSNDDKLKFYVDSNQKMTVRFPEVSDYHYCEHYKITINNSKSYDVVSNYYKYLSSPEENYYILDNVPFASSYSVKVEAYDFFDNVSLNYLSSSNNDQTAGVDPIDYQATLAYSDIQNRNRFDDVNNNSKSSIEYYYKGKYTYAYGAILTRLLCDGNVDCRDFITLQSQTNVEPTVRASVKNLSSNDIVIGLVVVDGNGKWKTDFGVEYQVVVQPGAYQDIVWNLKTFFGFTSRSDMSYIGLKAKLKNASSDGYEMNFLVDNIDIDIDDSPIPGRHLINFNGENDLDYTLENPVSATGTLVIDFLFGASSGTLNIALLTNGNNYYGYFYIGPNSSKNPYNGVTVNDTDDGFKRFTFDIASITTKTLSPTVVNRIFISCHSTITCQMDINPTQGHILRGDTFNSGVNYSKDIKPAYQLTSTFVFDIKFTTNSNTYINCILGDGWQKWFGYFKLYPTTLTGAYDGLTVTTLSDGYIRFSFALNEITVTHGTPTEVSLFFISGSSSNAAGYIDINPK